jgi:hypothetical protein
MDIRLQRPIVLNHSCSLSGLVGFERLRHRWIFGGHAFLFGGFAERIVNYAGQMLHFLCPFSGEDFNWNCSAEREMKDRSMRKYLVEEFEGFLRCGILRRVF